MLHLSHAAPFTNEFVGHEATHAASDKNIGEFQLVQVALSVQMSQSELQSCQV